MSMQLHRGRVTLMKALVFHLLMHKMEKQQTNHALMQRHDGTRADEGIKVTHMLFYTYQTRTLFQSLSDDEKGGRGSNKQQSTN
jgi:hypothetical protein